MSSARFVKSKAREQLCLSSRSYILKYHSARVLDAFWGKVYVARPIATDARAREIQYQYEELAYIQGYKCRHENSQGKVIPVCRCNIEHNTFHEVLCNGWMFYIAL